MKLTARFVTILCSLLLAQTVIAKMPRDSSLNGLNGDMHLKSAPIEVAGATVKKTPKVGAFMKNIYSEEYFSASVMSDYFEAFYEGYNMQDYAFAEECQEHGTALMDQLYEFNLNMTRRKSTLDPYYLIVYVLGN